MIKKSAFVSILALALVVPPEDWRPTTNSGHLTAPEQAPVGLMAGRFGGTYLRMANDLARLVSSEGIRVVPMVGQGSVQALNDLVNMQSVDIAMFQSDVLSLANVADPAADLTGRIRYISTLYQEELHLLAQRDIRSIWELNGKAVSVGPPTAGTFITSLFVLDDLGVDIDVRTMTNPAALAALQRGEIAAMIRIVGQPASLFQELPAGDLHFLPIPAKLVGRPYRAAQLLPENYPHLIDRPVETVSVLAVMATLEDPKRPERQARVNRLAKAFFSNFEQLRHNGHHPKWREVDPTVNLPGWQRLTVAEDILTTSTRFRNFAYGQ